LKKSIEFLLLPLLLIGCSTNQPIVTNNSQPISIHDIQGCAHISPYTGKTVRSILGIVTWKDRQGFFIQENDPDDKDCSSEAIYVFTNQFSEVIPGDSVSVGGTVQEFSANTQDNSLSTTEIEASHIKILSTANPLPDPVKLNSKGRIPPLSIIDDDSMALFDPESDGLDFYESLEGMRVEVDNAVVVGPEDSYKEVTVIPGEYLNQNIISSQGALITTSTDQNPERIRLVLPDGWKKTVNLGAVFTSPVVGILSYEYGNFEIIVTNMPTTQSIKVKPDPLSLVSDKGTLRLTTYNVENLNRFEDEKMDKLADQIVNELDQPDILLLQEIEDDSGTEDDGTISAAKTLKELVDRIQEHGGPKYSFVDHAPKDGTSGGIAGGNIRVVVLYRTDRGLELSSTENILSTSTGTIFSGSRLPIIVRFTYDKKPFYVIGVHLVSNTANSPEFGSIQPVQKPEESERIDQAQWIIKAKNELASREPDAAIFVAGDFNDTPDSKTLQTLQNANMLDLSNDIPLEERYSILFDGNALLYDQILVNKGEENKLTIDQASVVHCNSYLNEKQQTSDHDPFSIDFSLN
jgi:predicted extracellular nuclease